MRKTALIISLFLLGSLAYSQMEKPRNLAAFDYKTLHWGFTVGINSMDFAIKRDPTVTDFVYADVIGFQPAGFQVNIVSDLRLSDYWNLRFLPGINLGSRDIIFFNTDTGKPIAITGSEETVITMGSSFLDFPLLLKYRSERVNNYRPYVIGGLSYRLDMSANNQYAAGELDRFLLKKSDLYIEMGFGIDTYLQYFKFAPEIKLAIGLFNVMNTDNPYANEEYYANSISALHSFLVMVNFHFE